MGFFNNAAVVFYLVSSILQVILTQDCGYIKAYKPAIAGREVTFTFSAPTHISNASTIRWILLYGGQGWRSPDSWRSNVTTNGLTSILYYTTNATEKSLTLYAESGSCRSKQLSLDLDKDCGSFKYDAPAIAGRYVRFSLKPQGAVTNTDVKWYTVVSRFEFPLDHRTSTFNSTWTGTEFNLDYKADKPSEKVVTIFAKLQDCSSHAITAKIKEANIDNCGVLYTDPERVRPGEDVELRYYPAKAILDNPKNFEQEWRFRSPNCTKDDEDGCRVQEEVGKFEATNETFYGDPVYKLLIKSLDSQKDGTYFVKCVSNTYTLPVNITTPVKPSPPTFPDATVEDFCKGGCLVGKINEVYIIKCETHGGTDPVVDIYINNEKKDVNLVGNYYVVEKTLVDPDHNMKVRCEVINLALTERLVTETTLYVAKEPSVPVLQISEMKEGFPVNVTCTSTGGRPPTNLKLRLADVNASLDISMSSHTVEGVITSIIRLNKVERQWNGEKLKCCSQHVVYDRECVADMIDYKFPPLNVLLNPPNNNFTAIKETYYLNVTCSLFQFNAQCETGWLIDGVDASYVVLDSNTDSHSPMVSNLSQTVQISVSKADNGKSLECFARCLQFPNATRKTKTLTISVPYQPVITLDPGVDTVSLAEGDSFTVKCLVDSFPAATISWVLEADSADGAFLVTEPCRPGAASCSLLRLKPVTGNMTGTYVCLAKNPLSANVTERRLAIVVNETETRYSEKQSIDGDADEFLMPTVIVLAIFVVLVGVIIAVVVVRRRSSRKKESYTAAKTVDRNETNSGSPNQAQGGAEGVESYATYATPLPKCQRPGAASERHPTQGDDTYAMPLPKSQRPNASPTAATVIPSAPKELIYADLDLQPSTSGGDEKDKAKPRIIGDSETEYVDIDFSKKVTTEPGADKENLCTNEEENVYANQ